MKTGAQSQAHCHASRVVTGGCLVSRLPLLRDGEADQNLTLAAQAGEHRPSPKLVTSKDLTGHEMDTFCCFMCHFLLLRQEIDTFCYLMNFLLPHFSVTNECSWCSSIFHAICLSWDKRFCFMMLMQQNEAAIISFRKTSLLLEDQKRFCFCCTWLKPQTRLPWSPADHVTPSRHTLRCSGIFAVLWTSWTHRPIALKQSPQHLVGNLSNVRSAFIHH